MIMLRLKFLPALVMLAAFFSLAAIPAVYAQDDPAAAAIELFNAGQDAHEKGDLKKAVELYRDALKIFAEFPEAEYQLANALLSLNKIDEAETELRKAIELREDWTLPMTALGSILVQKGKFEEAEELLTKAIESDDSNAPAFAALADLRLRTKASPAVLSELLTRVRALSARANPTAGLWIARAALERALGDPVAARNSVSRALAIEPQSRTALAERAEIALAANDAAAALADAEALVRSSPTSTSAKFLEARALAAAGRTADALKAIDSIPNRDRDMDAFRERLLAAMSENSADLEKRLEADPRNATILGRLCAIYRTSDPLKALEYCRRANEVDPKNIDYVIGYAAALVQAKQFDSAVALLGKVIAAEPDNYTARANLAVALFQLKRFPEAKTQYIWLAERRPDVAVTYYFLGIIHDQMKEYLDAMANYQQFLKIADADQFRLEIEKVKLRLPLLQKQIKK